MRIWQPGVQGNQGGFDAKSDDDEPACHQCQSRLAGDDVPDVRHGHAASKGKQDGNTEQYHGGANRRLGQVFEACFQRGRLFIVECHQEEGADSHDLKPDPQVEKIRSTAQPNDGTDERQQERIKFFFAILPIHIRNGKEGHAEAKPCGDDSQQQSHTIHTHQDGTHLCADKTSAHPHFGGQVEEHAFHYKHQQGKELSQRHAHESAFTDTQPSEQIHKRRSDQG
ncbi:hypothetical protein SDC9_142623 [bioreactor metagenome]|uniref:Uncharacterized protein n=1 Tax=bioreactor metagenome TaxID=1076179 RepID=A0A645E1N7_9ZZZZ